MMEFGSSSGLDPIFSISLTKSIREMGKVFASLSLLKRVYLR